MAHKEYTVRGGEDHAVLMHRDRVIYESPDYDFLVDWAFQLNETAAKRRSSYYPVSHVVDDEPIG